MLNDAVCFKAVYIVCGYTDLRSGMDSLAAVLEAQTGSPPYVPDTLYLFCGRRADRIKGLVWEKDGWLMLYKRLAGSRFQWPRSVDEVRELTWPAISGDGRFHHGRKVYKGVLEKYVRTGDKPAGIISECSDENLLFGTF